MHYEPRENYQKTEHYVTWAPRRTLWRGVISGLLLLVLLAALAFTMYAVLDGQNTIPWWDSPLSR